LDYRIATNPPKDYIMLYRTLGKSGLNVSAISLGSWITFGQSVNDAATQACMTAAYDAGVNFFDGAEAYGRGAAEEAMGRVFKKVGWRRDTLVISTKVIHFGDKPTQRGVSRKHLVEAVDAALVRMNLDYVDLAFCHRPDDVTPVEEIVHTMNQLINRGKILYWGTSEFSPADLMEMVLFARSNGLVGPTMEQTNHSMLHRRRVEGELKPLCDRFGLGTTIYSPLAQGVLSGKYNNGIPADGRINAKSPEWQKNMLTGETLDKVRKLSALASELGISTAELALAWCLKNPHVSTAIIGATRPEQVLENVKAVDAVAKLDAAMMERIEKVLENRP
jgi:voltage-dependent potassium channel beta subunit